MTSTIITDPEQIAWTAPPDGVWASPAFRRIRIENTGENRDGRCLWATTTTWRTPYGQLLAVSDWTIEDPVSGRIQGRRTDYRSGPAHIRIDTEWTHRVDTGTLTDMATRIAALVRRANEQRDHDVDAPLETVTLTIDADGVRWDAEYAAPPQRPALLDPRRTAWRHARSIQTDGPIQPPLPDGDVVPIVDMAGTEARP